MTDWTTVPWTVPWTTVFLNICLLLALHYGCFLHSCFSDGCFLDSYFSDVCFSDVCFLDGCFSDSVLLGWLLLARLLLAWLLLTWNLNKAPLGKTGCLGNPYFLLTGCLVTQFFDSPQFSQHSYLGHLWLPTPHCAALLWLTGDHTIPLVIKCFPPKPYPGK